MFDRGISRGETPRLWIDAVAHVAMGRDKRGYRFLHDSRMGRHVLAESHEIPEIVQAVTTYVARRLDRAAAGARRRSRSVGACAGARKPRVTGAGGAGESFGVLLLGFLIGVAALFAVACADRNGILRREFCVRFRE